tara:strand:+ start:727 stop:927 length:201 start_codon:yes stop_codon:yes gene_type:complete
MKVEIIDYELSDWVDPPYCREAVVTATVEGLGEGTFSGIATSLGGGDWELDWTLDDIESTFEETEK